jgi:hypothetical protein
MNEEEKLEVFLDYWKSENQVKTSKLMMFFLVQSVFAAALNCGPKSRLLVPLLGMAFSFEWFFCIGRTIAFQKYWKTKIDEVQRHLSEGNSNELGIFPTPQDELQFPVYGRMPSKYILLLPPVACLILWLAILVYRIYCSLQ